MANDNKDAESAGILNNMKLKRNQQSYTPGWNFDNFNSLTNTDVLLHLLHASPCSHQQTILHETFFHIWSAKMFLILFKIISDQICEKPNAL